MYPKIQFYSVLNNMSNIDAKNHTVEKYFLVKICQIWVVFDATTQAKKELIFVKIINFQEVQQQHPRQKCILLNSLKEGYLSACS